MWVSGVTIMLAACVVVVVVMTWAVATGRIDATLAPPRREMLARPRRLRRPPSFHHRG